MPPPDPALITALALQDATSVTMARHGSSSFSQTYKLTAVVTMMGDDGGSSEKVGMGEKERKFFVKTGGREAEGMFAGEYASLQALHTAIPSICPRPYAHGPLAKTPGFFLATAFLSPSSSTTRPSPSLATSLARLHTTPAPTPKGKTTPHFGFPHPTNCGSTMQPNTLSPSWPSFYATQRLRPILDACEARHGTSDATLRNAVTETIDVIVPRLLGEGHLGGEEGIVPVLVHGDLWSGNVGVGRLEGDGEAREVVFDPAACWAHSEYEMGIMRMFGGFGRGFWEEYRRVKERDEPVGEFEDRVALYELYHQLNHYAMFGGGYREGAMGIMKRLIGKYGGA